MDIVERLRKVDESIWLASAVADSEKLKVGEWSHEAADEIERLREALKAAKDCIEDKSYIDAEMVIDNALQQKGE